MQEEKNIWQGIAATLAAKGWKLSWELCEKKLRNLKQSYKHIKDNNSKTGRGRKSWEYFDILDEIYGTDATVVLPHIVETLASASASEVLTPATLESESETVVADGKTTLGPSSEKRRRKRLHDDSGLKEIEVKKVKVLEDLVQSNVDRTIAMREMNETLKQLLTKL